MSVPTHTPVRLILGREPAAISAAIMSIVALVSGFLTPVAPTTQALIQTLVGAVLALGVLVTVRENIVPGILAVVQAALPLIVVAGADLDTEQQGMVYAAASLVLGLVFGRPNLTPKVNVIEGEVVTGSFESTDLAGEVAVQISQQLNELIGAVKDGSAVNVTVVEGDGPGPLSRGGVRPTGV